jgi:hypothetical protein
VTAMQTAAADPADLPAPPAVPLARLQRLFELVLALRNAHDRPAVSTQRLALVELLAEARSLPAWTAPVAVTGSSFIAQTIAGGGGYELAGGADGAVTLLVHEAAGRDAALVLAPVDAGRLHGDLAAIMLWLIGVRP